MATERTLDDIDLQILDLLQANARETQVEIAKAVGLAPSAVQERIRKLEARGTLRGYAADIDANTPLLGELPELDSLAVVELAQALENHFDIVIDDEAFTGDVFATVGSLADFVASELPQD